MLDSTWFTNVSDAAENADVHSEQIEPVPIADDQDEVETCGHNSDLDPMELVPSSSGHAKTADSCNKKNKILQKKVSYPRRTNKTLRREMKGKLTTQKKENVNLYDFLFASQYLLVPF